MSTSSSVSSAFPSPILVTVLYDEPGALGIRLKRVDLNSPVIAFVTGPLSESGERHEGASRHPSSVLRIGDVVRTIQGEPTRNMPQSRLSSLLLERPLRIKVSRNTQLVPKDSSSTTSLADTPTIEDEPPVLVHDYERVLIERVTAKPLTILTTKELKTFVEADNPKIARAPTARDMDDSILLAGAPDADVSVRFAVGQWVEYLGLDFVWHLVMIRRVVKVAPDSWDPDDPRNEGLECPWSWFYDVGAKRLLLPDEVRVPTESVLRHFGQRPFVFLQYALLRTEYHVRLELDHERDYQRVAFVKEALSLWSRFRQDERNSEFQRLLESKPEISAAKLEHYIMSWFSTLDQVSKNEEKWNLEGTSILMWTSVLGSGFLTVMVCVSVQIIVTIFIAVYAVQTSDRFNPDNLFDTTFDQFCTRTHNLPPQIMNFIVLCLYLVQVLPEQVMGLFDAVGDVDTPRSYIRSLREDLFQRGMDRWSQRLGFKLERYMNTLYTALIAIATISIGFLQTDAIEIILNALALEFLGELDEELAAGDLWDPNQRYLRAGLCELIFMSCVNVDALRSSSVFCSTYDVDPVAFQEAVGGSLSFGRTRCLWNDWHARRQDKRFDNLSPRERLWKLALGYAKRHGNADALRYYRESVRTFGVGDRLAVALRLPWRSRGIFNRFEPAYLWDRWDKVLFLPLVPEADKGYHSLRHVASRRRERLQSFVSQSKALGAPSSSLLRSAPNFANYTIESSWSPWERFMHLVFRVLTLRRFVSDVFFSYKRMSWWSFLGGLPFRVLDGLLEWLTFFVVLVGFPACIVVFTGLLIVCF